MKFQNRLTALKNHLTRSKKTLLLIISTVIITTIANVLIANWSNRPYSNDVYINGTGTLEVTGLDAHGGDIKTIDGVKTIDWGNIHWSETKTVSFYLCSISNIQTRLAFNVIDWKPTGIENYVRLSWNYNGTYLAPAQEILVNFTLSTADTRDFAEYLVKNKVTSYTFELRIYTID